MSVNRNRALLIAVVIAVALLLWSGRRSHNIAVQQTLDRMDNDAAAAKAAAAAAAVSAEEAVSAARKAQNVLPGSS